MALLDLLIHLLIYWYKVVKLGPTHNEKAFIKISHWLLLSFSFHALHMEILCNSFQSVHWHFLICQRVLALCKDKLVYRFLLFISPIFQNSFSFSLRFLALILSTGLFWFMKKISSSFFLMPLLFFPQYIHILGLRWILKSYATQISFFIFINFFWP